MKQPLLPLLAFLALASAAFSTSAHSGEAPAAPDVLGMRVYTQELTLVFATPEDAAKATLTASPVFDGKKWAFSARWDDNNANHEHMHAAMAKHGLKGTFYLNQTGAADAKGVFQFGADFARKLSADGFSIGSHAQTHPLLTTQTANEIFYEVLANRIERERQTSHPINTFAFPFGNYSAVMNPNMQAVITQVFVRSGLHNTPYAGFVQHNPGLKPFEISTTFQVEPGDREVKADDFDKKMDAVLHNKNSRTCTASISACMSGNPERPGTISMAYSRSTRTGPTSGIAT